MTDVYNYPKETPCCNQTNLCHAAFPRLSQRTSSSPAAQYQRLKQIQKTVRVAASQYTMNLASLSAHQAPKIETQTIWNSGTPYVAGGGTNWNQMSDRKIPHVQTVVTANANLGPSSTKHTITRMRPGAGSPGGIGVDIKHNCYERYLNRLKAGYLVRGKIPDQYPHETKNLKTAIVSNNSKCTKCDNSNNDALLYQVNCDPNPTNAILTTHTVLTIKYNVGDFVWAQKCRRLPKREKAQIIDMTTDLEQYTVKFADCCTMIKPYANIQPYIKCAEHLYPVAYVSDSKVFETVQKQIDNIDKNILAANVPVPELEPTPTAEENGVVTICDYLEFKNYQETWNQ